MIDFNDVNRYLPTAVAEDALATYIAAAEEHVQNITGRSWLVSPDEEVTDTFYNVREGAILYLTDYDAPQDAVVVTTYRQGATSGTVLVADVQYQVMSKGRVQLFHGRTILVGEPESLQPFTSGIIIGMLSKVTVTYMPSGTIPQLVKDITAQLAAVMYTQGPAAISGIISERIGDYSYTRAATASGASTPSGAGDILSSVKTRLLPYSANNRVRST